MKNRPVSADCAVPRSATRWKQSGLGASESGAEEPGEPELL